VRVSAAQQHRLLPATCQHRLLLPLEWPTGLATAAPLQHRTHLKRFGGSRSRLFFLLRTRTTLLWMAALTQ
jgi:hypothetical protein